MDPTKSKTVKGVAGGILGTGATGLIIFMFTTFQQKSDAQTQYAALKQSDRAIVELVRDVKKDWKDALIELKKDFRHDLKREFRKLRRLRGNNESNSGHD